LEEKRKMPITWDETLFNALYQIRIRDPAHPDHGQIKHYTRAGMARAMDPYSDDMTLYEHRWSQLTSLFTIPTIDRILIGGCAFGWLIEVAKDAGWPNVYGIDNSPYVVSAKNNESLPGQTELRGDVVLVEENFTGGGAIKNALKQATGDREFDWIITESVLESYSDAELPVALNAAESVLYNSASESQIIHLVSPMRGGITGDSSMYWRTLIEYAAFAPTHTWVDISTWEVIAP